MRGSAAGGGLLWPPYQRAARSDAFTRDPSADRDRGFRAVRPRENQVLKRASVNRSPVIRPCRPATSTPAKTARTWNG